MTAPRTLARALRIEARGMAPAEARALRNHANALERRQILGPRFATKDA